MVKKVLAFMLAVCILGITLCACSQKTVSAEEAYAIVLEDLGESADAASEPHIHEGTYKNKPCYNIFVTVGEESLVYIVTEKGEIVHRGVGAHSH